MLYIHDMSAQNSNNEQRIPHLEKTISDLQSLNKRISLQNVQQLTSRDAMGNSILME